MSNPQLSDTSKEVCGEGFAGLLAVEPFRSLHIHFGMLLGVDDFEVLSAYHRGKMWLHSSWLHGQGAVWGLGASLDLDAGEIRVEPGLAIDGLGRELVMEQAACVKVARWLDAHREDADLDLVELPDGAVRFDAHVVIRFKACLARQVPALVEPCDGSGQTTAYSRVVETAELLLRPGLAPEQREPPGTLPYHRLRLLFSLEDAIEEEGSAIDSDQEVLDARDAILVLPAADQPRAYLGAFRRFAALDQIDMSPASAGNGDGSTLFRAAEPGALALANVRGLTFTPSGDTTVLSAETGGGVDNTVRFVHVATSTIQELLNGPRFGDVPAPGPGGAPGVTPPAVVRGEAVADAGGPRVEPTSVSLTDRQIAFSTDQELHPESVKSNAFAVTAFDESEGWHPVSIRRVRLSDNGTRVSVVFGEPPQGTLLRLVARGTGPEPLLGRDLLPLAGTPTDPPASTHDGNDFVFIQRRG